MSGQYNDAPIKDDIRPPFNACMFREQCRVDKARIKELETDCRQLATLLKDAYEEITQLETDAKKTINIILNLLHKEYNILEK
jgi:hypothetical protein